MHGILPTSIAVVSRDRLRILGVGPGRSINFLRWASRLTERGHEVHLASTQWSDRPGDLDGFHVHDPRSSSLAARLPIVRRRGLGRAVGQVARGLDVDLVHGHYLLPFGYWAAQTHLHPLVMSPWGTDILIHAQRPGRGQERARAALTAADFLVTNSTANETASVALGADPSRMRRIIWYADVDRFAPEHADSTLRTRLGWPEDAWIALSLRNHRPNMNLDVVVGALAHVAEVEPRAHLVMAAQPSLLGSEIERLVSERGLTERVRFTSLGRNELPALVASCDALVSVTSSDSTPASLLEGMASALPAVCASAPSIDEWVEQGEGAEIVPPRDEEATAEALLRLLRDPALGRRYGERNARVVRERIDDPGRALEDLYRELVSA
jgi:glycosyltransferase involved in cell wall biosynthesis